MRSGIPLPTNWASAAGRAFTSVVNANGYARPHDPSRNGVAFVVATDFEHRAVASAVASCVEGRSGRSQPDVLNCGIGLSNQDGLAHIASYRCVVSTGFAAGLDPKLKHGAVSLPETVLGPTGTRIPVSRKLHERVYDVLSRHGPVSTDALVHTTRILRSPAAKRMMFESHRAGSADMESASIGSACADRDLPYLVLRVILDPAHAGIPLAVMPCEDQGLPPDARTVVRRLAGHPRDVPPFLALLRYVAASRRVLIRSVNRSLSALGDGDLP